jgi:hypothetical protein
MFRTELQVFPAYPQISLQNPILLLGSCFSDNIGTLLKENKFTVLPNPFGVIYNPISIFNLLESSILGKPRLDDFFLQREEVWYHYDFHSEISTLKKEDLEKQILEKFKQVNHFFSFSNATTFLILTLGTAFVYELKGKEKIVANCHKMPSSLFEKRLLSPESIVKEFEKLYGILPKNLHILLTVSPVRHIKDTIPLNSVSKSVLRLACHQIAEEFENVSYFPAYELMIDDLRDYRFYEADMLHPNSQAITYIFHKFVEMYLDASAQTFLKKWEKIYKSLQHKPFYPHTSAHQQFLRHLLQQLEAITEVEVSEEIHRVKQQMI